MRFDRLGKGVHEELEHVFIVQFTDPPLLVVIALGQRLHDGLGLLVGQQQPQVIVLDPLAPQLVQFSHVGRPGLTLAVELVILVDREIERLLDADAGIVDPLLHPLGIHVEDLVGGQQIRMTQRVVHAVAVALEHLDVAGQEVNAVRVQQFQVAVENLAGKFIVQPGALVVVVGQKARRNAAGIPLIHVGLEFERLMGINGGERSARTQQKNGKYREASHLF